MRIGVSHLIYEMQLEDCCLPAFSRARGTTRESVLQAEALAPGIVVIRKQELVAWASACPYRTRECYSGVAEHSVYVHRDARYSGKRTACT